MCFTPGVSLTTAIIEIVLATFVFVKFRKYILGPILTAFLFLLGMYQFSELMICTTSSGKLWALIGMISYTFLPATALHLTLRLIRRKCHAIYLYIAPILFSLLFIFTNGFILKSSCEKYFVNVQSIFSIQFPWIFNIYLGYYSGFMIVMAIFLIQAILKEKKKHRKQLYYITLAALIFSLIPAIIFVILVPTILGGFPSIYCQFAILFAIMAIFGIKIVQKNNMHLRENY